MYTLEQLQKENPSFDGWIDESELENVNKLIALIESTRSNETPKAGDNLRYTDRYGDYYPHAHIEYTDKNGYGGNICESGSCALVWPKEDGSGISCSGSGGPWTDVNASVMKYIGTESKTFWTWSVFGAGAHRGIFFKAKVSVWEYDEPEQETPGYTTKEYDKFYVSDSGEDSKYTRDTGYRYHVSGSMGTSIRAFKDTESYKAWLKTFNAMEINRGERSSRIVWAWKENQHHVSPDVFDNLEFPEDTFLMNGSVRRCKREYDNENKTVNTYFVWYWGDSTRDYAEQNKVIDSYKLDWHTPEYILARKEIGA